MNKSKFVVVLLMLPMLLIGMIYSLQAPFYPQEAESHGLTPAEYGLVFGIYELSGVLISIPLGKYAVRIGIKFILIAGLFLISGSTLIFGTLDYVQNKNYFFVYSICCRLIQSIAENGIQMSILAIISKTYAENVATLSGWTETMFALGLVVGPFAGSFLYSSDDQILKEEPQTEDNYALKMLSLPPIWGGFFTSAMTGVSLSFLAALFEPHIRQLNLSIVSIGFLFLISGLGYIIACHVFGRLCDKGKEPGGLIIWGTLLAVVGMSLIGPLPYIPIDPSVFLVIPGLFLNGLGLGAQMVSSLIYIRKQCVESGLGDCAEVESLASGIWISGFSFGGFIGPTVGGALFDIIGFREETLGIILLNVLLFIFILYLNSMKGRGKYQIITLEENTEDTTMRMLSQ